MSPLDQFSANRKNEDRKHDRHVADYSLGLAKSAFRDLKGRPTHNRKDSEHRWTLARRGALLRLISKLQNP